MSVLEFKEISQGNLANGKQDEFELFARDFFAYLGYEIISEPDRGQDGGKDLLVKESRKGVGGETALLWLVSCKHFAHSNRGKGKAVGIDDEVNVLDRVESNKCDGFIGFYSTIASSGLNKKLQSLSENSCKEFKIFHRGNIEESLFRDVKGIKIARRYFPGSLKSWNALGEEFSNTNIFDDSDPKLKEIRQKYYEEYIRRKKQQDN